MFTSNCSNVKLNYNLQLFYCISLVILTLYFFFFLKDNRTPGWCLSETYLKFGMNPREDNVWIPDDTYYCKLIGRLVDNILH